jgi:hypothetical protein
VGGNGDIPCVDSEADGSFELVVPIGTAVLLSLNKDGYLPLLFPLSGGTQRDRTMDVGITMATDQQAEDAADAAGATYPEETTGGILAGAVRENTENEDSPFTFTADGGGEYIFVEGATVVLEPESGVGPVYLDADEAADSSLEATSASGRADFYNVEPGDYTLQFTHPELDCGEPILVTVVAGYTRSWTGVICVPKE